MGARHLSGWALILCAAMVSAQDEWVSVPGTPIGPGFAWYRCVVQIPADWDAMPLRLQLGRIGDCDETFVNGARVGASGILPPEYAGARDVERSYAVAARHVRAGGPNLIAVRVYAAGEDGGFRGGRLELSCARGSMPLGGTWRVRKGDDAAWARWPGDAEALVATFRRAAQRPGIPLLRRSASFELPPGGFAAPAHGAAEAIPVGTGELTASVFGGIEREQLRLTDGAGRLLADVLLTLQGADEIVDYARSLDLHDGIARVAFRGDGVDRQREVFASASRQVIVLHAAAAKAGAFSALINLGREDGGRTATEGEDTLVLTGERDAVVLCAVPQSGSVRSGKGALRVQGDGAFLLMAASSGVEDPHATCLQRLEAARSELKALRAKHVDEHRAAFGRTSLRIDADDGAARAFALGRYLGALFAAGADAAVVRPARERARAGGAAGALELLRPLFLATTFDAEDRCGVAVAIGDLLVQRRDDRVVLLPALPAAWPSGQARGLSAGRGLSVDLDWRDGELQRASIVASEAIGCSIEAGSDLDVAVGGAPLDVDRPGPRRLEFSASPGIRYELRRRK